MKSPVTLWRKQKKELHNLGKEGRIVTWTKILVAPPKFQAFTPYVVVLVELENKQKMYGQLVDFEETDLMMNKKVKTTLRKSGSVGSQDIIEYAIKFKPINL